MGLDQADGNEALIAAAPELHAAAAEVFAWIDCGFLTVGVLADDSPARVAACGRAIDALAAALGMASADRQRSPARSAEACHQTGATQER